MYRIGRQMNVGVQNVTRRKYMYRIFDQVNVGLENKSPEDSVCPQ